MEIIYQAVKEMTPFKGSFHDFMYIFTTWQVDFTIKHFIAEVIMNYYDVKFNIVLVSYNGNLIKIQ